MEDGHMIEDSHFEAIEESFRQFQTKVMADEAQAREAQATSRSTLLAKSKIARLWRRGHPKVIAPGPNCSDQSYQATPDSAPPMERDVDNDETIGR